MTAIKEQFDAGVKVVQSFSKHGGTFQPSTTMLLTFYAFYKQATQGECRTPKPSFYDVIGKAKWDAWRQLGSMSSEQAMQKYVNELKKIVEAMPQTDVVQDFVEKLGNFYEMVDENDDKINPNSKNLTDSGRERLCKGDRIVSEKADCEQLPVEEGIERCCKSETVRHINGFLKKVEWPEHCRTNLNILSSEPISTEGSKVKSDSKSSESAKVDRFDDCQDSGNTSDDDNDENDENEEEDKEDEDKGEGSEEEDEDDEVNKEILVNQSPISDDTFDEDEFCDTVDVPFQQDEQSSQPDPLTNSSNAEVTRKPTSGIYVQTESSLLESAVKRNCDENDEVLSKIGAAVEAMQRNVFELEKQIKTLNELHGKKVQVLKVFDFLNQYKVPGLCFVVLWPVVVNFLFNRYYRSSKKS